MSDVATSGSETTVSEVAAELARRGLDPNDRVMITIEPDEFIPGRREARLRVIAAGLTDDDIDRLIDEARAEAHPPAGCGLTLFMPQPINAHCARAVPATAQRSGYE
jgi:hypothetical protein